MQAADSNALYIEVMSPTMEYPGPIRLLIEARSSMPLDRGTPASTVEETLGVAMLERVFGAAIIHDKTSARLCLAGLWLLYDHLNECHEIAQSIETQDGSYWHAIMHRREGDYSNSKYWYAKVGRHPIYPELSQYLIALEENVLDTWDPYVFVDRCEQAMKAKPGLRSGCEVIQMVEWRLLFDHCYGKAIAATNA